MFFSKCKINCRIYRQGACDIGNQDARSLPWLVELLARFYRLDLAAVRRHTGRLLGLRHHIPLPLADGLVLLPVKVRQAAALGENTAGYVNLLQVKSVEAVERRNGASGAATDIDPENSHDAAPSSIDQILSAAGDPALGRSRITCRGGLVIYCLNTAATVKAKLRQGETARQELLQRQKFTVPPATHFSGLDSEGLQIGDTQQAIEVLSRINYYRLSAHMLTYKVDNTFLDGVSFKDVYDLYEFDKRIRNMIMGVLETIEVAFRTHITYLIAHKYGATGYMDAKNFFNGQIHEEMMIQLDQIQIQDVSRQNRQPFLMKTHEGLKWFISFRGNS
ncbi:MAG: Abi family protein [Dethiobacter sp.]|nr:MAG: Abi family protein [Dethiobacter sp.]